MVRLTGKVCCILECRILPVEILEPAIEKGIAMSDCSKVSQTPAGG